jgi:hypothetical protein
LCQLRAFPFALQDEDSLANSTEADAAGVQAASHAVTSSARSVSTTLYPDDMLAIQQQVALEAAAASAAAKLAADRLAAATAAAAVVNRLTADVLRRFPAAAVPAISTPTTNAAEFEQSKAEPADVLKDLSHEAAARAAERAAAENAAMAAASASAAASHTNPIRVKPKPKLLSAAALPSNDTIDVPKLVAASTSASVAPAPPALGSTSGKATETLHSILSRLDLLHFEVSPARNVQCMLLLSFYNFVLPGGVAKRISNSLIPPRCICSSLEKGSPAHHPTTPHDRRRPSGSCIASFILRICSGLARCCKIFSGSPPASFEDPPSPRRIPRQS